MKRSEFLVYNENFMRAVLEKYSENWKAKRFMIPIQEFGSDKIDSRSIGFMERQIHNHIENDKGFTPMINYYWELKQFLVIGVKEKMKKVNLMFPYEYHEDYYDALFEINNLICSQGVAFLYINNVPYSLKSGIMIETTENYEKILDLAKQRGMQIDYSVGVDEIFEGIKQRQYNLVPLLPLMERKQLENLIKSMFFLPSKKEYEKQGYGFETKVKKKIFVSYCHADKAVVRNIIDRLRASGLDFWIDENEIDYGDNIISRVDEGMRESHLPIIFLSKHTKNSRFAEHELSIYLSKKYLSKNRKEVLVYCKA